MFKFLKKLFGSKEEVAPTFQEAVAKGYTLTREYPVKVTYVKPESRPITGSRPEYTSRQSDSYTSTPIEDMALVSLSAIVLDELLDSSSDSDTVVYSSNSGFDGGFGGGGYSGGGSGGDWSDSNSSDSDSYSSDDSSSSSSDY